MAKQSTAPVLAENKMGTMPIGRLLVNMATPMIIAMLVQAMYNIVDSIYVSRISENAVTALSLAYPIQNLQIGFAIGIGVGVNALLSKSLGQHDQEQVDRSAGNGLLLALLGTVLFMAFGVFGARTYFELQSDVKETVEGGTIYTAIYCFFSLGIFVEVLGERLLQSTGRTMYTMITQGTGAVLNIILDPVFIFGWGPIEPMGMAGAAMATVIGQWVAALLAIVFNLKFNPEIRFSFRSLIPHRAVLTAVLVVGIPSIVMNGIGSVMNFGMNQILLGFYDTHGETPAGVFGIYFKLQSFFFMPLFGLNNATISILAYNYGARRPERIVKALKIACVSAVTFMLAGLAVFQLAPDLLLGIFDPSPHFLDLGRGALRTISLCFPLAAACIALGACFQALGNGIYSTVVSLCRQLFVLLPVAYLLSLSGRVELVWWAFPIAELMSLAATLFFFVRIYRQKIAPMLK